MGMSVGGINTYMYYSPMIYHGKMEPADALAPIQGVRNVKSVTDPDERVKLGRKSSPEECQTCKERKYVDGSNEGDVSFKAPGHVSPQASVAAVMSHEMEHVANAMQEAGKENAQLLSATVSIKMAVCPECGTVYAEGGTTNTKIRYEDTKISYEESNPYAANRKVLEGSFLLGRNVDLIA